MKSGDVWSGTRGLVGKEGDHNPTKMGTTWTKNQHGARVAAASPGASTHTVMQA